MCVSVCVMSYVRRSEDNASESVFSFHHVSLRDGAQVTRLSAKHLCLLSSPTTSRTLSSYQRLEEVSENTLHVVREIQKLCSLS